MWCLQGETSKKPLKNRLVFSFKSEFQQQHLFFPCVFFWAALFVETMFQLDCLFIIAWIWVQPCPIMQSKNNLFHVICLMNLHFPPLVVQGYTQNMYTPNSPELWRNLCPCSLFCIIFKIKKQWFHELCHDATLKRNMVCLFLDDSKSWQLETNRPEFHHGWPSKFQPPKKESLLYTPENAHWWTPKNAGFESMIFLFWAANQRGVS